MTRRIWLGVGGGALVLLLSATLLSGAVFAQDDDESATTLGQAFIERLAGKLGITSDELQAIVRETRAEMLDEAVASGRLTEEQAAAMQERVESGDGRLGHFYAHGPRHGQRMFGHGLNIGVIADELGVTPAELREQLAGGATLAEIIEANGATVDEIVAALVEQARVMLDEAVASGRVTQEQADERLARLSERLTEAIESGLPCLPHFERNSDSEAKETSSI